MGCDIHGYIEFRNPERNPKRWEPMGGQLWLERNYLMFGLLAGVRDGGAMHIPPRGIPGDLGWEADEDYHLYISEVADDRGKSCTQTDALSWVASGLSVWTNAGRTRISNPDWHTPSWLTTAEYAEALRRYTQEYDSPYRLGVTFAAALGAMIAAEEHGCQARLVFWFDN